MVNVSNQYKIDINKLHRNMSSMRINLSIVDSDALDASTVSDSNAMYYSDSSTINIPHAHTNKYMTMEHNRFILDGNGILPPEVGSPIDYYQGYVSSEMSGENMRFTTPPSITINFSNYFKFTGLTFTFDRILGTYCNKMRIYAYYDDVEVYNKLHYPTAVQFVTDDNIPATGFCNKIVVEFLATYPARRRINLEYIVLGLVKTFTDDNISSTKWDRHTDLLSTSLETNVFSFNILDVNKEFNPENTSGYWRYVGQRQPVTFDYGYELSDGKTEWIRGGTLYTDDTVSIDTKDTIPVVKFKAVSILSQLTAKYYKNEYNGQLHSLYDLATDVLTFANLSPLEDGSSPYYLDPVLQTIYTPNILSEVEINKALQTIANAGLCVLKVSRNGQIRIERLDTTLLDFNMSLDNIKSTPSVVQLPIVKSIKTKYKNTTMSSTDEEIASVKNLVLTEDTTFKINYTKSTEFSMSLTGTLAVVGSPYFYSTSVTITLSGSGDFTLYGHKLIENSIDVELPVNPVGYDCVVSNELINTEHDALEYAKWIANDLFNRNSYKTDDRGYPELDTTDVIRGDTSYGNALSVIVTDYSVSYNGALSGSIKYISLLPTIDGFKICGMFNVGQDIVL